MARRQIRISRQIERRLLANPSVVGFADTLRPKIVDGKETRTLAIRVLVERKRARPPRHLRVPRTIDGIPTDVVAIGKIKPEAKSPNRTKQRPLLGGCTGTRNNGGSGTLGYFMRDKKNKKGQRKPQWYALSCAHVLDPGTQNNRETLQPSPNDGGKRPQDWVGRLYRGTYNGTDAALSKIDVGAKATIIKLSAPPGSRAPKKNMTVVKSGRTTGRTTGTIGDVGLVLRFANWGRAPGPVVFRDVFVVTGIGGNFSERGDSGSLVLEKGSRKAIGLLFGGDPGAQPKTTLVSRLSRVEARFPAQMLVKPGETYP